MSKAGAHCWLPAASAWLLVWPVPCPWLGIHVHEVAESQLLRLYPCPAQHPSGTRLSLRGHSWALSTYCWAPQLYLRVAGCWQAVPGLC